MFASSEKEQETKDKEWKKDEVQMHSELQKKMAWISWTMNNIRHDSKLNGGKHRQIVPDIGEIQLTNTPACTVENAEFMSRGSRVPGMQGLPGDATRANVTGSAGIAAVTDPILVCDPESADYPVCIGSQSVRGSGVRNFTV